MVGEDVFGIERGRVGELIVLLSENERVNCSRNLEVKKTGKEECVIQIVGYSHCTDADQLPEERNNAVVEIDSHSDMGA